MYRDDRGASRCSGRPSQLARVPMTDEGEGYKDGRGAESDEAKHSHVRYSVVYGWPTGFIEHRKAKGPRVGKGVAIGVGLG